MNLTLAITTYNRYEMLLESFAKVIGDPRIDEVLIMDDHSEDKYWNKIKDLSKFNPKIKVARQDKNRGMSENKHDAIALSKSDWVIIFDSDNVLNDSYLNNIPQIRRKQTIYAPSFAKPNFDYRIYQGNHLTTDTVKEKINEPMFNCFLNTANYVVHRDTYLNIWEENKTIGCADTIWFNYLWLKAGNGFYICPGMWYEHRIHKGSGFVQEIDYNLKQAENVKRSILAL